MRTAIIGTGGIARAHAEAATALAERIELVAAVDAAIAQFPDAAEKVRGGNQGALWPLVGAVMKATGGAADAKRARELLLERLAT